MPQYNGNISGITWRNKTEATGKPGMAIGGQGYSFGYDDMDRQIQNSYYTQSGGTFTKSGVNAFTENTADYDEMSNLLDLDRKDKNGTSTNDLHYDYQSPGTHLLSITDFGSLGMDSTYTYTYDGNGNMISDSRKGMTLSYNYLDLVDTVKQLSSKRKLVFTYDASGNKLYKQLIDSTGAVISQRHYVENLEVVASSSLATDGKVESITMDEGRIVNTGSNHFEYEYYLQDHLYNTRVTFRPGSDTTNVVSMIQNYYPFGGMMGDSTMNYRMDPGNQYLYQGKELQGELGLDTYDFGARQYDPYSGRWMGVDPMAETSEAWSPYNYVLGNPMNVTDPDGMQPCPGCDAHNFGTGSVTAGQAAGVAAGVGNLAMQLANSWRAFSLNVSTLNWSGLSQAQGNVVKAGIPSAPRSSIPQVKQPVQLYKGTLSIEKRDFINKVTSDLVKEYNRSHGKAVHVGKFNPATGRIEGSGAVDQIFPENALIQIGLIVATEGLGTAAELETGASFFEGTTYTNKVLGQLKNADFHAFPESVKAFEGNGVVSTIRGGDGITRQILKISGEYRGKSGTFEFIKEANGTINHRLFRPVLPK